MKNGIKKRLSACLVIFTLIFYVVFPVFSLAEEIAPTPTQDANSSIPSTEPTATPTETAPSSKENTIDNNVANETPTPTPPASPTVLNEQTSDQITPTPDSSLISDITPTPTLVEPDATANSNSSNSADLNNTIDADATTGDNSIAANSSETSSSSSITSLNSSSSGTIQTGDAISVVNAQNSINTTSIDSSILNQTVNIYVTQDGNLNLSDPFTVASNAIQAHPDEPVVNVSFTNVNNFAYLSTTINSLADTGNNTANQNAVINTGNAYSVVSLLNQVNFTVINSRIHIVTINIFGKLNGNIILPNLVNTSTNCQNCGITLLTSTSGTLINDINLSANTGQNTATGSANIQTGDASSSSSIINLLNTNLLGVNTQMLFINVLGNWIGNFIGWDNLNPAEGNTSLSFYNLGGENNQNAANECFLCNNSNNIINFSSISNTINSSANTGANSLTGNGSITTGDAFSALSLINFINSTFINSTGFFGFVNIFGDWIGDIGGQNEFNEINIQNQNNPNETKTAMPAENINSIKDIKEEGGQLEITSSNNVGSFVYPGDTVTFFIKVKNTGRGKVYGAKLDLYLIRNSRITGGTTFNLGDIEAGRSKNLTTGFVLFKNIPEGVYFAKADAYGTVGPDDNQVKSSSQNSFRVFANQFLGAKTIDASKHQPAVLGSKFPTKPIVSGASKDYTFYMLLAVIFTYALLRMLRHKRQLKEFLSKNITAKEKIITIKTIFF